MNCLPPRTGRTSLTDAELCLFDALFDVFDRLGALRQEHFVDLNLPYTHDLDPIALEAVVRRLVGAGLLRLRSAAGRPDLGPWVGLTSEGGRLWEIERAPDWRRFCSASARPEGPQERWTLRVRASVPSIAEAFLQTAQACGLHSPELPRLSRRQIDACVVPWKRREPLIELRVPLHPTAAATSVVNWALYEARRTWWQTVPELTRLAAPSPG